MNKKVKMSRTVTNFSILIYLWFSVFLVNIGLSHGQSPIPNTVEVRIRDVSLLPGATSFAPSALQQVYFTYNVNGYVQKYPSAIGLSHPLAEGVTRVYDLVCDCDATQLQNALSAFSPDIFENVYLNYEGQLLSPPPYLPNDPQNADWNFWPHDLINTPEAWDVTKGDPGIKIAVTDVGFDIDHPDLVDKIVYMDPGISLAPDPTYGDHGTGTAFTAAGGTDNGFGFSSAGFNCSLMLFPAFSYNKMLEAANLGANIINCSWVTSCSYNANQHDIVKIITDIGAIIVAGAGNGNAGGNCGGPNNDGKVYPASYPEVISVTGTAHYGCLETTFNCWGPAWNPPKKFTHNDAVDIAAPGFCVMKAIYDDNFGFSVGTSTSSPMVGGVIGLMLSVDPCLTPSEVTDIIKGTSQNLFDGTLCNGGANANFQQNLPGVGLVDANASVISANASGQEFHVNAGGTLVWDNQTIEAKDIYVHSGGTLIIRNGSYVSMKKGKSIIVEREAKLIVDNSTIAAGCSKSLAKWRGIFVHGNASLPQPNLSVGNQNAVQNYVFSPGEAGVVALTNHARIENARYGISTSAPGYDYDPGQISRWGGLVLVDNATFYNVIQGVEFIKYDLPNKSRVVNSTFTKSADYQAKVTGITVWENTGLEFSGNTFEKMDYSGIGGIDFSAKIIDGNKFEYCKFGVEIHSTAPHTSSVLIKDNYFDSNETHVYSAGTSSDYGLQVIHNEFFTSDKYGVRIEGPSAYNIEKNSFSGNAISGVAATNTSDEFSFVRGNFLGQGKEGLSFYGNNSRTQFLSNCFTMDETDVVNEQIGANIGRVRSFQGNSGLPAGNCFTSGIEHIRAVLGQTQSFKYFVPLGGEPQEDDCFGVIVPNVNGNNFTLVDASVSKYQGCGTFERQGEFYTFNDLNTTRNDKFSIKQGLISTPNDPNLLMQLDQKEEQEDRIEAFLEQSALQSGDFDLAESIYAGLTDRDAKLSLYGIKLKRRQFAQARTLLNGLTVNSTEEQLFAQIQDINLDRWQQTDFVLGEAESNFLYNAAMSDSEVRAYAGALYFLLTGERAIPDLPNQGVGNRADEAIIGNKPSQVQIYAVYPIPANSSISLAMPEEDQRSGIVEIHDITGKRLFSMPFAANSGSSLILPVKYLPKGFLILSVRRAGLLTFTSKIILQD